MGQPRQYSSGIHFLAPSFTEFLNGLAEVANEAEQKQKDLSCR